jgi:hypothetical protein
MNDLWNKPLNDGDLWKGAVIVLSILVGSVLIGLIIR